MFDLILRASRCSRAECVLELLEFLALAHRDEYVAGLDPDMGLRIDHVWVTEQLARQTVAVMIDKEPRRWEKPSDHAPVVSTVTLDHVTCI